MAEADDEFTQQGEECLNLNIWAPSSGTGLPVFVYVYGGAMVTGSSSNPMLQGSNFARKGVIYVNFNARESLFASPYSSELVSNSTSQNFGILDVDAAMEWVHTNIKAFGGDPSRIVMGGHSSGSVHNDHYLWNHPDTFLAGAIEMSANAESGPAYAPKNVALDGIAGSVNCSTGPGQLDCLREVDIYDFQTTFFNSTSNTWFCPIIDNITRFSDYPARFAAGKYPKSIPLIVGNTNNEGGIFSYVYSTEDIDFYSWINTFDAELAHIPHDELLAAYNASDYESDMLMSCASYGEARFLCATDYFLDLRSSEQNTWVYRWFGDYDNVNSVSGLGATHGSELAFFHGGNNCFEDVSNVTTVEQELADFTNDWLVTWIKNPSAGPGWEKANPIDGPLALLGVPGNETTIINARTGDYNAICQSVDFGIFCETRRQLMDCQLYKRHFPQYPVVQNPTTLAASSFTSQEIKSELMNRND